MPRSSTERAARATRAYIGLGANLGDRRAALDAAFRALAVLPQTTLRAASSLYRSAPIESSGADYLNAVVGLDTRLAPDALLAELLRIERAHGRERPYRNAPRTLDLDLLLYGARRIETLTLTVPHPRLHERAFVLVPLAQIAPHLAIPGLGRVIDLLAGVSGQHIDKL
jgi:2-amino-4-hydroxy-6-hydroxymethyldihydropteridine diphosphokinase